MLTGITVGGGPLPVRAGSGHSSVALMIEWVGKVHRDGRSFVASVCHRINALEPERGQQQQELNLNLATVYITAAVF